MEDSGNVVLAQEVGMQTNSEGLLAVVMSNQRKMLLVHPHTVKKFELMEAYAKDWAPKLLNNANCEGIVFIDCMCGSGIYQDEEGKEVFGTPIRIAQSLSEIMVNYPQKYAHCFFSDLSAEKIEVLNNHLPSNTENFCVRTYVMDGNMLLRNLRSLLVKKTHTLLFYDPYEAAIDWEALEPYLKSWVDVILNHVVSDPVRAISQVKRPLATKKYEHTYESDIKEIIEFGSDRVAYEKRIQEIMARHRRGSRRSVSVK